MISENAWKIQASFKDERNFAHSGKILGLVIKYKSQMQTGLSILKHTIKFFPK